MTLTSRCGGCASIIETPKAVDAFLRSSINAVCAAITLSSCSEVVSMTWAMTLTLAAETLRTIALGTTESSVAKLTRNALWLKSSNDPATVKFTTSCNCSDEPGISGGRAGRGGGEYGGGIGG